MIDNINQLASATCIPYSSETPALTLDESTHYIKQSAVNWTLSEDGKSISRLFKFKNYYETMAFVNVAAMIAHQQDHHPEITVNYNNCLIEYSTHSIDGLSKNDFICAVKTDNSLTL